MQPRTRNVAGRMVTNMSDHHTTTTIPARSVPIGSLVPFTPEDASRAAFWAELADRLADVIIADVRRYPSVTVASRRGPNRDPDASPETVRKPEARP